MREKSPEGLSGQPRFLSGAERGARQEARRVAWILRHTSGLPPACIWWQGRSMAMPCFLEACCYLPCCPQLGVEGGPHTRLGQPEWQEVLGGFPLCPEVSHPVPPPPLPSLPPQPSSARRKAAASSFHCARVLPKMHGLNLSSDPPQSSSVVPELSLSLGSVSALAPAYLAHPILCSG